MIPRYASALLLVGLGVAQAQEATERFIPIGQSPGLSGTHTMLGRIDAVDGAARALVVTAGTNTYRVAVVETTRIWIDRSHLRQPTRTGTFADCDRGLEIEVKLEGGQENVADWIKIRADAG